MVIVVGLTNPTTCCTIYFTRNQELRQPTTPNSLLGNRSVKQKMKKQPEKTAQTKQSMIDAFWVIAKKRGLINVTVGEITKYADLNRSTFYVYFSDISWQIHPPDIFDAVNGKQYQYVNQTIVLLMIA